MTLEQVLAKYIAKGWDVSIRSIGGLWYAKIGNLKAGFSHDSICERTALKDLAAVVAWLDARS